MINILLISFPLFVCAFWIVIHFMMASRTRAFLPLIILLTATSLMLLANGVLNTPGAEKDLKLAALIAEQIITPCVIPLTIMYFRRIRNIGREQHPLELLWIVVPVILGTAAILLFYLSGKESILNLLVDTRANGFSAAEKYRGRPEYVFYVTTHMLYMATIIIQVIWLLIYFVILGRKERFSIKNLFRFLLRGGKIRVTELQSDVTIAILVIIIIQVSSLLDYTVLHTALNITIALLLGVLLYLFCYIALFGAKRTISLTEMQNAWRYNYDEASKQSVVEKMLTELLDDAEEEALIRIQMRIGENLHLDQLRATETIEEPEMAQQIFSSVAESWEEDDLFKRFQCLLLDEKIFLQPRLSLVDVADRLNSNTSYVSKMINNAYNLSFPELINTLRIDYAEQYILSNRDAKQTEIAEKCGFLSASSFNTIFKRVTGVTPKIWMASADRQAKLKK